VSEQSEYMALSVKQPWASLIASGKKTIETRTWATTYRGPLLIVSSKKPDIPPAGCALALVRLVGCWPMRGCDEEGACCGWYEGAWAWRLADIRRLKPFPVRGALGIYRVRLDHPLDFLEERGWLATFPRPATRLF
jgi:hypothetical protein